MTVDKSPVFCGSDAWLLFSIAIGEIRQGASLRDIIATGDYINHAVLNGPQIRRGIAKLMHSGYVRERNGAFLVTG